MKSGGLFALRMLSWASLVAGIAMGLAHLFDDAPLGAVYTAAGFYAWTWMLTAADFVDAAIARLDAIEKNTRRAADALDIISRG